MNQLAKFHNLIRKADFWRAIYRGVANDEETKERWGEKEYHFVCENVIEEIRKANRERQAMAEVPEIRVREGVYIQLPLYFYFDVPKDVDKPPF